LLAAINHDDGSLPHTVFIFFIHNESTLIVHAQVYNTSAKNDILIPVTYAVAVGVMVTTYESLPVALAQAYK
jgi:hypothetical protein